MAEHEYSISNVIPVVLREIGTRQVNTVDGRDIHAFLSVARDYSDWVKRQIKGGQFVENRDYIIFYTGVENSGRGRPSTEYYFTFRAAEHIGMMSRTKKGKEVRDYFLDLEEQMIQSQPQRAMTTAEMFLEQAKFNVELERRQLVLEAKVDALIERQPPQGKMRPEDWLRRHSKPFLPRTVLANFRHFCRQLEDPELWRPESYEYPVPYYSSYTLATAYQKATEQLDFIEEAQMHYRPRKR